MSAFTCKDCDKREIGCHGTCEDYKARKKEFEIKRNNILKAKSQEYICVRPYKGKSAAQGLAKIKRERYYV